MAPSAALPPGAIAGIAVGVAFAVVVTAITLAFGLVHRRRDPVRGRRKVGEKPLGRRAPESVSSAARLFSAKTTTERRLEEGSGSSNGGLDGIGRREYAAGPASLGLWASRREEEEDRSRQGAKERSLSSMGRRNTG